MIIEQINEFDTTARYGEKSYEVAYINGITQIYLESHFILRQLKKSWKNDVRSISLEESNDE